MFRVYKTQRAAEAAQNRKHKKDIREANKKFRGKPLLPDNIDNIDLDSVEQITDQDMVDKQKGNPNLLVGKVANGNPAKKGGTVRYAVPEETVDGKWAIPDHEDLIGGEVADGAGLFPEEDIPLIDF